MALKVQDENDSREIIKTPDAAFITQTGRGYLQVGNNEIYELFQSAWSGATYTTDEDSKQVDSRIYKINLLGQGELINKDLSDENDRKESMTTQLDVVVDYIADYYLQDEHIEVMKPWLPSLGKNLPSPYIDDVKDTAQIKGLDMNVSIGLMDIPEEQKQENYDVNFIKDGNLAIFSSSGYGKSTTLGTILLSLAIKNNPALLNMYIIDLGNSSLIPYKTLPHVADYMTFDSEEKLNKFVSIINDVIKERKQLFAKELVQNYDMYNQMHKDQLLKSIVIIIDNYDVVKEISIDFEDFIMKTTRDGAGLGIYTVITATRSNAVRFSTLNNFKNKIAQYMFDEGDVNGIVGRSKYKLSEDVKGRALVKTKYVCMMQTYAPVSFENDVEYINNLKLCIRHIEEQYTGERLIGIPVLPDVFTTKEFTEYTCETSDKNLIGLSLDTVQNISLSITNAPYVILGPSKSGKTNFIEILIGQFKGKGYIFDSDNMDLYKYKDYEGVQYISTEQDITLFVETLFAEVEDRKVNVSKAMDMKEFASPKEYYEQREEFTIFIDDADGFITKIQAVPNIASLINQAASVGINFVVAVNTAKLKGFDDITKFFKNATNGAVLGQLGTLSIFSINMRDIPTFGYAILCDNGDMRRVKLPKYVGFNRLPL